MPDAFFVYLSICLLCLALPFLPWHWIHHPTVAVHYQRLHSPITIQRSMESTQTDYASVQQGLIDCWGKQRKQPRSTWAWTCCTLPGKSAAPRRGGLLKWFYVLDLSTNHRISKAQHFLFFQAKAYLVRNDWWWGNLSGIYETFNWAAKREKVRYRQFLYSNQ